jgi:hypothetical protein
MRRSRAPSNWPGPFFAARSWADCTTNMFGFDLRQAHQFGWLSGLWPNAWVKEAAVLVDDQPRVKSLLYSAGWHDG